MEPADLVQVLILWYVVRIALDTTHLDGFVGGLSDAVGLALFFFLPLYLIKGAFEMIAESSRV